MFFVYVLICFKNNSKSVLYIGFTKNLKKRFQKHLAKQIQTTKKFDKIELIYFEACLNSTDARKRENQLKTGFGRGYIKKRIAGYLEASGYS